MAEAGPIPFITLDEGGGNGFKINEEAAEYLRKCLTTAYDQYQLRPVRRASRCTRLRWNSCATTSPD